MLSDFVQIKTAMNIFARHSNIEFNQNSIVVFKLKHMLMFRQVSLPYVCSIQAHYENTHKHIHTDSLNIW
jgi:hypothetical protein